MYADIGQEEPPLVKAEAAVPVRHRKRTRIGVSTAAAYLFTEAEACMEWDPFC